VADEMRIRVYEMHIATISMYIIDLKDRILGVANSNKIYI
jgi:hypothetical protein